MTAFFYQCDDGSSGGVAKLGDDSQAAPSPRGVFKAENSKELKGIAARLFKNSDLILAQEFRKPIPPAVSALTGGGHVARPPGRVYIAAPS
jgi:hypothetical protein